MITIENTAACAIKLTIKLTITYTQATATHPVHNFKLRSADAYGDAYGRR